MPTTTYEMQKNIACWLIFLKYIKNEGFVKFLMNFLSQESSKANSFR